MPKIPFIPLILDDCRCLGAEGKNLMENNSAAANESLNVVIDLSHHNTVTDFHTIKAAGIVGIIHKATQGTGYTDPAYASRRTEALEAGLWWGAYHFAEAGNTAAQADHFLSVVDPQANELLVLDIEQNYSDSQPIASMTIAEAVAFVQQIGNRTGRFPGLYSGSYIKDLLGKNHNAVLAKCWFWLAEYSSTAVVPANWPYWTMWQYTDGQHGPGPYSAEGVGACDRNKFNGDINQLRRLWGVDD